MFVYSEEHTMFRKALLKMLEKEAYPHYKQWEKDLQNGGENISIANLPKGSYFIRINGDKENATIKFIKM